MCQMLASSSRPLQEQQQQPTVISHLHILKDTATAQNRQMPTAAATCCATAVKQNAHLTLHATALAAQSKEGGCCCCLLT
jgi:hypothetical protein